MSKDASRFASTSPATRHYLVVPDDNANLPKTPDALYVCVPGALAMRDWDGVDVTWPSVSGLVPFRPKRILGTGTTATGIIALSHG